MQGGRVGRVGAGAGTDLLQDVAEGVLVWVDRVRGLEEPLQEERVARQALDRGDEQVGNVEPAAGLHLRLGQELAEERVLGALRAQKDGRVLKVVGEQLQPERGGR